MVAFASPLNSTAIPMRHLIIIVLPLSLVFLPPPASGQYKYPYPYPAPYPYPYPGVSPAGSYLYGKADVIRAQGDVMTQNEQARILREKAYQAKIDTKRKAFDEMLYEKANTPTFTEEQEKIQAMQLKRLMNQPTEAEVTSGKALNAMLPYVKSLTAQGILGPPVMLNPVQLKGINVSAGESGNSIGVLQGGTVDWPPVLQGPRQMKLDSQLTLALAQTAAGKPDFKTLSQITRGVQDLRDDLFKRWGKEEIDGGLYLTGKRFLDNVETAVKTLQQPGAKKYIDGSLQPRGSNVQELVDYMMANGLRFAPANPGNEASYFALHSAMVSYALASQSSTGFQAMVGPSPTKKK